ncbi:MAG: hypothetical protein ACOZAO_01400 [Patescibacteria group bacterium]
MTNNTQQRNRNQPQQRRQTNVLKVLKQDTYDRITYPVFYKFPELLFTVYWLAMIVVRLGHYAITKEGTTYIWLGIWTWIIPQPKPGTWLFNSLAFEPLYWGSTAVLLMIVLFGSKAFMRTEEGRLQPLWATVFYVTQIVIVVFGLFTYVRLSG